MAIAVKKVKFCNSAPIESTTIDINETSRVAYHHSALRLPAMSRLHAAAICDCESSAIFHRR